MELPDRKVVLAVQELGRVPVGDDLGYWERECRIEVCYRAEGGEGLEIAMVFVYQVQILACGSNAEI